MANKRIMTPEEKVLLQAKHRLEEIEARNRKKERNARTRRLIQEGAILESIAPHIKEMDLDTLKAGADAPAKRNVNTQVLLPKGALTHPPDKSGGGIPYGARALCRGLSAVAGNIERRCQIWQFIICKPRSSAVVPGGLLSLHLLI